MSPITNTKIYFSKKMGRFLFNTELIRIKITNF